MPDAAGNRLLTKSCTVFCISIAYSFSKSVLKGRITVEFGKSTKPKLPFFENDCHALSI